MKIVITVDLTDEWDAELLDHIAECTAHQYSIPYVSQEQLILMMSYAHFLERKVFTSVIDVGAFREHMIEGHDDLATEEREEYVRKLEEYKQRNAITSAPAYVYKDAKTA